MLIDAGDGRMRCSWGVEPDVYRRYHDEEWGRPVADERRTFEKLCLEGFQSGLSWLTILRKRDAFRAAFAGFDWKAVARFDGDDVARLLADPGIVRHRGKIEATLANARALVALHDSGRSLVEVVWSHGPADERPPPTSVDVLPAATPESAALSKELRSLGFRFVGPTTAYAAMQALGVVNDHVAGCWVRDACAALPRPTPPNGR